MHRVRSDGTRDLDQARDIEVTVARRGRTDGNRTISHLHMQRVGVGLRIDRHRLNPEAARGARDPDRDLPAVGDQQAAEHGCFGL